MKAIDKTGKLHFINIKSFCCVKGIIKRVKNHHKLGKNIYKVYVS